MYIFGMVYILEILLLSSFLDILSLVTKSVSGWKKLSAGITF